MRHKQYPQLLRETGLSRWKLDRALDALSEKGMVDSGFPEAGESVTEFYWLTIDPPGPYWLDREEDESEKLNQTLENPEQEIEQEA